MSFFSLNSGGLPTTRGLKLLATGAVYNERVSTGIESLDLGGVEKAIPSGSMPYVGNEGWILSSRQRHSSMYREARLRRS
jgi:hypothetical protein